MSGIDDLMTPEELAYDLFKGLPPYQYETNKKWLKMVFAALRVGGIWAWPDTMRTFRKVSNVHFVEIVLEEE